MKKFRKQAIVIIENIKNDIFENFKNSKITPKNPKPQIQKYSKKAEGGKI